GLVERGGAGEQRRDRHGGIDHRLRQRDRRELAFYEIALGVVRGEQGKWISFHSSSRRSEPMSGKLRSSASGDGPSSRSSSSGTSVGAASPRSCISRRSWPSEKLP